MADLNGDRIMRPGAEAISVVHKIDSLVSMVLLSELGATVLLAYHSKIRA
jgi:hypothetical protein